MSSTHRFLCKSDQLLLDPGWMDVVPGIWTRICYYMRKLKGYFRTADRDREKDQGESQCKSSQSYKFDLNSGCIIFNDDEYKSGDDGDSDTEQRHNNNILLNMHQGDLCCPTSKLKVVRRRTISCTLVLTRVPEWL